MFFPRISFFLLCLGVFLTGAFVACDCQTSIEQEQGIVKTNAPGQVTPSLIFLQAIVGQKHTKKLLVSNAGKKPFRLTKIALAGKDKEHFAIEHPPLPIEILPGVDRAITLHVHFSPPLQGSFEAELRMIAPEAKNASEERPFVVKLQNKTILPALSSSCESKIVFGEVGVGAYRERTCRFKNTGQAPLKISKIEQRQVKGAVSSSFSWDSKSKAPLILEPKTNDVLVITIRFAPKKLSIVHKAKIALLTNIPGSEEVLISLDGKVKTAAIAITPVFPTCHVESDCEGYHFSYRCQKGEDGSKRCSPGKIEPKYIFPFTESGNTTTGYALIRSYSEFSVRVTGYTFATKDTAYQIAEGTFPFTLEPRTFRKIKITYSPKNNRPESNTLTIQHLPGGAKPVTLTLEASSRGCNLRPSWRKLEIRGPGTHVVEVKNDGIIKCEVNKIFFESKNNALSANIPRVPLTLLPGNSFKVPVTFQMTSSDDTKIKDGKITIESSDTDQPKLEIPISIEIGCFLKVDPTSIQFSSVTPKIKDVRTVTLSNLGQKDCTFPKPPHFIKESSAQSVFHLAKLPTYPLYIPPGGKSSFQVEFIPLSPNETYSAEMAIVGPTPQNQKAPIPLAGKSLGYCLKIYPPTISFTRSFVGCESAKLNASVYHTGTIGCPKSITLQRIDCKGCYPDPQALFRFFFPKTPPTLKAYDTVQIPFSFRARKTGLFRQQVTLYHSMREQPISISLVGTGTDSTFDTFRQASSPVATFTLTQPAIPSTISVRVNWSTVSASTWTYDQTKKTITFQSGHIPRAFSTIQVNYRPKCDTWP